MKSRTLRCIVSRALLGSALTLAMGGVVAAADGKAFPGAVCQAFYGAEQAAGQQLYHANPSVQNYSSSDRLVLCPIERDNNSNTNGLTDLRVQTIVSGASISCAAISITQTGSFIKTVWQSTPAMTGLSLLKWGATLNVSDAAGSVYDIQCTIPSGASIVSINYTEP